jgi:hypothetical protein
MISPKDGGSSHSLSSLTAHDDCFRSVHHAKTSLNRMETYLLKNQLTDITLIAGTAVLFILQETMVIKVLRMVEDKAKDCLVTLK